MNSCSIILKKLKEKNNASNDDLSKILDLSNKDIEDALKGNINLPISYEIYLNRLIEDPSFYVAIISGDIDINEVLRKFNIRM